MLDRILIGSSAEPSDPNFENVTLLLHGDGSNGAQNNTFIDSSTNNFTITRNGNTTQGSFSPYGSNWSNYFDGSGDYLTVADNAAFGFGTGDFTIEMWVFCAFTGSVQTIIDGRPTQTATPWLISIDGTGLARSYDGTIRTGGQLTANQWNHMAWVRASGVNTVYVNGVSGHSWTNSGDFGSSRPLSIGRVNFAGGSEHFNGYISNIRILKGTALYTSNFTPSTTPLTAITNTSLLTCADNRFRDGSTNNFTITRNGDVKVTNFAPFAPSSAYSTTTNGGSAYFDGSGDRLSLSSNSALAPGSGNFTFEFWLYPTSLPESALFVTNVTGGFQVGIRTTDWGVGRLDTEWYLLTSTMPTIGQWNHIAISRSGTNLSIFLNGTRVANRASGGADFGTGNCFIFADASSSYPQPGYMTDMRFVKGTAVYDPSQTSVTIPSSPVSAITNTNLLIKPTNAAIFDNSMKNDLETVGNAQISTSVKKFGTGSMYFDGASDYLNVPTANTLNLGAGNCTVECWVYFNSTSNYPHLFEIATSVSNRGVVYQTGGKIRLYANGSDRVVGTTTVTTGTWYHVAVVSVSGVYTLYVDGTSQGTYSGTVFPNADSVLHIGFQPFDNNPADSLNGYIDEFRITKGVARYTANFTPPTAPFPNK